jgi:hypothetical protein
MRFPPDEQEPTTPAPVGPVPGAEQTAGLLFNRNLQSTQL